MNTGNKRDFLKMTGAAMAGAGLAACGSGEAAPADKPAFVLVHGGWHGSWCYEAVAARLASLGHTSVACDLPGHGLNARLPATYYDRPATAAFAADPSLVASVTLDDYAAKVLETVDRLRSGGHSKVFVVCHSMAGIALNRAGELAPEKISGMVYLAANMPASGVPIGLYFSYPENAAATLGPAFIGDAFATGGFRIDPLSPDPAYRALLRQGFYNDLPAATAEAAINLLTPDLPTTPMVTPITLTAAGWGSLPRHFIKCLRDNAVPVALADRFIAEADAFTPANRTKVHTLDAGHSPFLSKPDELASLLSGIALGV